MRPDRSSLQSAFSKTVWAIVFSLAWIADLVKSVCSVIYRSLCRLIQVAQALSESSKRKTSDLLSGPMKQFVFGPFRRFLLGRRINVSLLTILVAPALALVAAWWVSSTIGYEMLVTWVRGTWFGTNPSLAVFTAAGVLVALGTLSAVTNSGILPTTLLVSAPIFGAAVTRYGTTVTYSWGTEVVSLPNAVGTAILFALSFGIPIGVTGFLLGSLFRRVVGTLRSHSGPASPVKNP